MLTRIEIDGFKTFEDFRLDLMPLCMVTGPNAVGKSNLFDAIRLLSRMVSHGELGQAFADLRGRPSEQFRHAPGRESWTRMTFATECLLDPSVEDAFGNRFAVTHRHVRYRVVVARRRDPASQVERLFVEEESAEPIPRKNDRWAGFIEGKYPELFRNIAYSGRRAPFLETQRDQAVPVILARQDGVQGRGRPLPADRATATYLSTVNDAKDFGHLFALRQCLSDVVFLQADPTAERKPADHMAPADLEPNAANLAAVLHRIKAATATSDRPDGALTDISNDLAALVPGVSRVRVTSNEQARQFEVSAEMRSGLSFSSRLLSDGTLRLLALVTVANDPKRPATLCFEEPENGVSEARVGPLIQLLRDACADPGPDQRLFQVLMNSHSPRVLDALEEPEAIFADLITVPGPGGALRRKTRMRSVTSSQLFPDDQETGLTAIAAQEMLRREEPENA